MKVATRRQCLGVWAAGLGGVLSAACGAGGSAQGGAAGGKSELSGPLELLVGNRFDWTEPVTLGVMNDFRTKHPNLRFEVTVDAKEAASFRRGQPEGGQRPRLDEALHGDG